MPIYLTVSSNGVTTVSALLFQAEIVHKDKVTPRNVRQITIQCANCVSKGGCCDLWLQGLLFHCSHSWENRCGAHLFQSMHSQNSSPENLQKAWPPNALLFCSQSSIFQRSKENKPDKLMPSYTSLQRWLTERGKVKDLFEARIIQVHPPQPISQTQCRKRKTTAACKQLKRLKGNLGLFVYNKNA